MFSSRPQSAYAVRNGPIVKIRVVRQDSELSRCGGRQLAMVKINAATTATRPSTKITVAATLNSPPSSTET